MRARSGGLAADVNHFLRPDAAVPGGPLNPFSTHRAPFFPTGMLFPAATPSPTSLFGPAPTIPFPRLPLHPPKVGKARKLSKAVKTTAKGTSLKATKTTTKTSLKLKKGKTSAKQRRTKKGKTFKVDTVLKVHILNDCITSYTYTTVPLNRINEIYISSYLFEC